MTPALRNELTKLAAWTSLGLWFLGYRRAALGMGAAALVGRAWPLKMDSFSGRSVVITGGSRGLGLALAEEFVKEGAWVSILARDEDELRRAKNQLAVFGGRPVSAWICDVTDGKQVRDTLEKICRQRGGVDVLVNNAGSITAGPFASMEEEDFEAQVKIHLGAAVHSLRAILPIFSRQGQGGRIVNICSLGGKFGVPHMAPYCASKFALSGFAQSVGPELLQQDITMTTVYPGLMRTGSAIQAVFKGNHEKEFAWFAMGANMPGLSITARSAARQILCATREGRSEVVLSPAAKLGVFAHARFPELFQVLMSWVNRTMPRETSTKRKTGALSRRWLDQRFWSGPFTKEMDRSGSRYNEDPKEDAAFNMNLH
ncbi:MAG: SDR family oxidoreductase [Bdellovibrionaceae bacterium]|nr:SDR family oxidoreductase [Pseudobdellovibrionaceae bacterium]